MFLYIVYTTFVSDWNQVFSTVNFRRIFAKRTFTVVNETSYTKSNNFVHYKNEWIYANMLINLWVQFLPKKSGLTAKIL